MAFNTRKVKAQINREACQGLQGRPLEDWEREGVLKARWREPLTQPLVKALQGATLEEVQNQTRHPEAHKFILRVLVEDQEAFQLLDAAFLNPDITEAIYNDTK